MFSCLLVCNVDRFKPIFHCDAKPLTLGPGVGFDPQRHNFALGIPTCWYLKTQKYALPSTSNLKFAFHPTRNPNASQWNIGCVGSSGVGAGVGHVHFRLFGSISFAFGGQRKRGFQWNMGSRIDTTGRNWITNPLLMYH